MAPGTEESPLPLLLNQQARQPSDDTDNEDSSDKDDSFEVAEVEIDNVLGEDAWRELGETPEIKAEALETLRRWLNSQTHIENCRRDSTFLLKFLRFKKHQIKGSCSVLENYLEMRAAHPHWFQNLDIRDQKLQELVSSGYVFAMPGRDKDGRRVVFSVARALDPSRHSNGDAMRAHLLTFEALLEEEECQVRGFTYIFDCSGLTLSHLAIWTPSEVTRMFSICEKNLPVRHRDINVLWLPFPMRAVLEFCKSLLSDKIRRRFCLFGSLNKLKEKLGDLAPSLLPAEYGGDTPLSQLTAQWAEHLEHVRPTLLNLDTMKVQPKLTIVKPKETRSSLWSYLPSFSQTNQNV